MAEGQRRYSEQDIAVAQAYAATAPNMTVVAEDLGIPYRTVHSWLSKEPRQMPDSATVEKVREAMADRLEALAHKAIDQANDQMHKASASQAAVVVGIAVEKMRLLRDQSTSNLLTNLSETEAEQRAAALIAKTVRKIEASRQTAIEATFVTVNEPAETPTDTAEIPGILPLHVPR